MVFLILTSSYTLPQYVVLWRPVASCGVMWRPVVSCGVLWCSVVSCGLLCCCAGGVWGGEAEDVGVIKDFPSVRDEPPSPEEHSVLNQHGQTALNDREAHSGRSQGKDRTV